ncbi:malectin domain-containing carbohydrate-binding protein [Pontibacter sp. CAU 1760]
MENLYRPSVNYPDLFIAICSRVTLLLALLLCAHVVAAQWTRVAYANQDRSEVTSVVYQNRFYTFIGFGDFPEIENSAEVYDPVLNTWKQLAPMPSGKAVTHMGVALVDDQVWFVGGRLGRHPGPLTSEVWRYDMKTDKWLPGPELKDPATGLPVRWAGGGLVLVGRTLHVVGGFVESACNSDQKAYHLTLQIDDWLQNPTQTTWQNKRAPMPLPRNHFSTVALEGKIYTIGGQLGHDCSGGFDIPDTHVYNPVTDTWKKLTSLPSARSHAEGSSFALDGKIYVVAGQGEGSDNVDKVTVFYPDRNNGQGAWEHDPAYTLPNVYEGLAAKVIGNTFIMSHGGIGSSNNTQRRTYTAPIARNPSYRLGFTEACISKSVKTGGILTIQNLLFAQEGQASYTLSADVPWVTFTRNSSGVTVPSATTVEVSVDALGLQPGKYTANITAVATDKNYTNATFCIKLTVAPNDAAQAPIRINAGGETYTGQDGVSWAADAYATGGETSSKSFDVSGTSDDPLYLKYRYASGSGSSAPGLPFGYRIPVVAVGTYSVRLHLMEPVFRRAGERQFHVDLEGQRVLSGYDIFAAHGRGAAVVLSFPGVQVRDGVLNIDFTSLVNNAIVSGVEVIMEAPVRINVGGESYTGQDGVSWAADAYATGGETSSKSFDVSGTSDDPLYLKYRYASGSGSSAPGLPFGYRIPVVAVGTYSVRLHLMEPVFRRAGERQFHVDLEGQRVLSGYDIFAAHGRGAAVVLSFPGVQVRDGALNIDFISLVNNAIICAIEVRHELSATAAVTHISETQQQALEPLLNVSPNPNAGHQINVWGDKFGPSEHLDLSIQDMAGRMLYQHAIQAEATGGLYESIALPQPLRPGMYIIQLTGKHGKLQCKLLVL